MLRLSENNTQVPISLFMITGANCKTKTNKKYYTELNYLHKRVIYNFHSKINNALHHLDISFTSIYIPGEDFWTMQQTMTVPIVYSTGRKHSWQHKY